MTQSLFERLGGTEGIKQIANDIVECHLQNPAIATRFAAHDPAPMRVTANKVPGKRIRDSFWMKIEPEAAFRKG